MIVLQRRSVRSLDSVPVDQNLKPKKRAIPKAIPKELVNDKPQNAEPGPSNSKGKGIDPHEH
jgi:hypothetical protein